MSHLILGLTTLLLAIPGALVALALLQGGRSAVLLGPGLFVGALYLGVWLYARPTRFEVAADALRIVWPVRRQSIPRDEVSSARLTDARAIRSEFGWAVRIGAGGLWGGFGWLWTTRRGLVDFYVSRTDGLVLLERRGGRPLLLTPERPAEFVRALGAR
jgi:hypothetical protein